ncbi:phage tail spike protein [Halobacillus naozhouensis]|uniref:Phage tail spike protein n=1 Tax=Halobacillus naozhouensis TaxID=554880 RepID=A0ABY8IYL5_9BACI|nr:phage tail spike protein [Halobacillus naozhouensis]WFT74896.1 phage tail spike protein [Halobacillus naozhouensis]
MIHILNRDRQRLAILENAYDVSVQKRTNQVWGASFSLPIDDPKNEHCEHFNFVEVYGDETGRYYGLYRIMPTETSRSDGGGSITYECEHVLATLLDSVMEGYHQYTNYTTTDVLEFILSLQDEAHWQLGTVDFTRYFHYKFENENGLLAPILSIPQPFDEPFEWTFDTENYPWTINLVRPNNSVKGEIRWGKNIQSFKDVSDPTEIVNWIIPRGYGEGVNQLTIKDVNGGLSYLKDQASIDKWGKKPYIWIDRRFEVAESLKASGASLLNQWKDPKFSFDTDAVDLSILPEYAHEEVALNDVVNVVVDGEVYSARIIGVNIPDLSKEYDVDYTIANKLDDIADIQADVERKQQVNEAYSQGATNIMTESQAENCDPDHPVTFRLWIAPDVVNINAMHLTYETSNFRGYTRGSKAGGSYIKSSTVQSRSTAGGGGQTTSAGGGQTTSAGGGQTTTAGGGFTTTSAAGGDHKHLVMSYSGNDTSQMTPSRYYTRSSGTSGYNIAIDVETSTTGDIWTAGGSGDHTHQVSQSAHSHSVSDHTHSVSDHSHTVSDHTHDFEVEIPAINIPDHSHPQIYGIYEDSTLPSSLNIKVDGNTVASSSLSAENVDLTPYLSKDSGGRIQRNRWATIEITPDDLARVNATVVTRLFVQSHIGGTY